MLHHAPQALKQAMHSQRLKRLRVAGPMPRVHGPGRPAAVPAYLPRPQRIAQHFIYVRTHIRVRTHAAATRPSRLVVSRLSSALVAVALELRSTATHGGKGSASGALLFARGSTRRAASRLAGTRQRRCSALRKRRALWRSRALRRRACGGVPLPRVRGVARKRLRSRRGAAPSSSPPATRASQGRREACRASPAWRDEAAPPSAPRSRGAGRRGVVGARPALPLPAADDRRSVAAAT